MTPRRRAWVLVQNRATSTAHYGAPYGPDRLVEWGSVTKLVTAATIAQLVDDRLLSYSTPIEELVPLGLSYAITIEHLVTHTSGLPRVHSGMSAGIVGDPYQGIDEPTFLKRVHDTIDAHPGIVPGAENYSNLGYAILGLAITAATSQPWFGYASKVFLDKAGLTTATLHPIADQRTLLTSWFGRARDPWDLSSGPYSAAGGIWSTLQDMTRYAEWAVASGTVNSAHSTWTRRDDLAWHSGQTRDSGVCLAIEPTGGLVVASHALGAIPGAADKNALRLLEDHRRG